jgi:hypothetical protein
MWTMSILTKKDGNSKLLYNKVIASKHILVMRANFVIFMVNIFFHWYTFIKYLNWKNLRDWASHNKKTLEIGQPGF